MLSPKQTTTCRLFFWSYDAIRFQYIKREATKKPEVNTTTLTKDSLIYRVPSYECCRVAQVTDEKSCVIFYNNNGTTQKTCPIHLGAIQSDHMSDRRRNSHGSHQKWCLQKELGLWRYHYESVFHALHNLLFQRRLKERELNPVLVQYRDPVKEDTFSKTLASTIDRKTKKIPADKFNIITHQGKARSGAPFDRNLRGTRDFNILSHFATKFHEAAPLQYDEYFAEACKRPTIVRDPSLFRGREFNILSNKFLTNHDQKTTQSHENMLNELREKYWRTHGYDPLKGVMYSEEKEQNLKKTEKMEVEKARNCQDRMLPKRYFSKLRANH
jgi:hypothetical protein